MVTRRTARQARWAWRDLKQHWVAIVVIALVIAIGTGVFAGLGSTGTWRRLSYDASFDALDMHDLRVSLSPGTFAEEGELAALATAIPNAASIDGLSERLFVSTQVDASTPEETILVGGRIVGIDPRPGPDRLWVDAGEPPAADAAVLETKFARTFDLPDHGNVQVSGGEMVQYRGVGTLPTDFYVSGETGDLLAQFNFAVLYLDLAGAQDLTGRPGAVNDLVLTLDDSVDRSIVERELQQMFDADVGLSATVTTRDDDEAFRILYTDIDNDARFWTVLSGLVLASAALAAFNLVSRIVEAQRREIGVGLALGATPARLSLRPLLVGAEAAVLGVLFGIVVGWGVSQAMRTLLEDLSPLPVWRTPFQFWPFAQAAALGLVVPIASAAVPVWRATRVEPIEAIRTGHLAARQPPKTLRRIRVPGGSLNQLPLRNVLRTPRRTVLTALGVGAAITALVAVIGILDSFERTIDQGAAEATQDQPDRITATLDTFAFGVDPTLSAIGAIPGVARVDPGLQLPFVLSQGDEEIDVMVETIDLDTALWAPTPAEGSITGAATELILSEDAARDLSVSVGDTVAARHPVRAGPGGFAMATSDFTVGAIHPNPLRVFAYAGTATADALGFTGVTNVVQVFPDAAADRDDIQRSLFETEGVAAAQPVTRTREVFEDAIEQFRGFLVITEGAVLALAMLISFNSTRITVEERTREHATMLAFGTPLRSVVASIVKEGVLVGALATVLGALAGYATLSWLTTVLFADTLPELGIVTHVAPATLVIALAIGVLAVALAPLLMARRLRRMNLPDTLRVVE